MSVLNNFDSTNVVEETLESKVTATICCTTNAHSGVARCLETTRNTTDLVAGVVKVKFLPILRIVQRKGKLHKTEEG
ncbi:hypothetical protein DPMN_015425 [Dreissena polymorpha]|uniref:Uncharacterized protein n=1 Tax=Dreissena polymorpha TaxID=45954 RepID=A0A9D4S4E7_DREPO|nr:hypothetical protein DPMN_015425 [Dreissena polymorpha]